MVPCISWLREYGDLPPLRNMGVNQAQSNGRLSLPPCVRLVVLAPPVRITAALTRGAVGAVNVNHEETVFTEEDRSLELAKTNVDMKRYLMLDLLLYEQAVAIHRDQLEDYGLN